MIKLLLSIPFVEEKLIKNIDLIALKQTILSVEKRDNEALSMTLNRLCYELLKKCNSGFSITPRFYKDKILKWITDQGLNDDTVLIKRNFLFRFYIDIISQGIWKVEVKHKNKYNALNFKWSHIKYPLSYKVDKNAFKALMEFFLLSIYENSAPCLNCCDLSLYTSGIYESDSYANYSITRRIGVYTHALPKVHCSLCGNEEPGEIYLDRTYLTIQNLMIKNIELISEIMTAKQTIPNIVSAIPRTIDCVSIKL